MPRPQSRPYHSGYERSLRPCLAPPSAPRRRGLNGEPALSEHDDAVRARFAENADRVAEASFRRLPALEARVVEFVQPGGDERALDVGTGTGPLAFALAPHVREVVGVDLVPELLERGRAYAADRFPNVELVEGDVAHLPFERGEFDLVCERAVLHHVARPELVVAEITRVTRPGGRVLLIDQLAPFDPLAAIELDRFERARDPSHTRLLSDGDLRALCEANGLMLIRSRVERHDRELDPYLDLSGCEGDARDHACALAPGDPYEVETGWYLLRRP
jgi:ubiquinone/menaquinone biosynthesis C-methylase UbiE